MLRHTVRPAAATAALFALLGVSRYLDGFIQLFLRQQTGEAFFSAVARNFDLPEAGQEALALLGLGLAFWLAVAFLIAWLGRLPLGSAMGAASRVFIPLVLPIGLTGLACLSLALSPSFPYGTNLVLTLAYEGRFASALVLGLLGLSLIHTLWHSHQRRLPSFKVSGLPAALWRRGGRVGIVLAATAVFALLTPAEFWEDGYGQGHMLRYLRMTTTLAGSGTLDIAQAETAAGQATLSRFLPLVPQMGVRCLDEAGSLLRAFVSAAWRGELYTGSMRAEQANRAMFRHPEGGIYYIMNPGPALVLIPAYLVDRFLNRRLGTELQVAVILFWNLLGALVLVEMMTAARQITGSPSAVAVSASLALGFAVPLLFYTYQVYPELPAALLLIYGFRRLLADPAPRTWSVAAGAMAGAFLPWLHQKYSLTAAVLGLLAAFRLARRGPPAEPSRLGRIVSLAAPLALSAMAILVYNHALTGSLMPDALYQAAERGTFSPSNTLRGCLGLLFDVENGILVFAPVYLLALAGFRSFAGRRRSVWRPFLAVTISFILVVGSVRYWAGPVSSVARFMLFVAPLSVLPLSLTLRRFPRDAVVAGFALTTLAATGSLALSFMDDRLTTYSTHLLLERVLYSDPYQYFPNFHSEGIIGSGPAHLVKLGALLAAVATIVIWLGRRLSADTPGDPSKASRFSRTVTLTAATIVSLMVVAAAVLEHLPGNGSEKTGPVYRDSRPLEPRGEGRLAVQGKYGFEGPGTWVPGGGSTRFLIRSSAPLNRVRMTITNGASENVVRLWFGGSGPTELSFASRERKSVIIPLGSDVTFEGPKGREWIYRLEVSSSSGFVPREAVGSDDPRRLGCYVVVRDI